VVVHFERLARLRRDACFDANGGVRIAELFSLLRRWRHGLARDGGRESIACLDRPMIR